MKFYTYFFLLFVFIALPAQAQQRTTYEQIKALKTAFITERLELTPPQAESFWPVYNAYDNKFQELRKRRRATIYSKIKNDWEAISDAEAIVLMDEYYKIELEELELEKQRTLALQKVISPKKIITLKIAEDDFRKDLIRKYSKNKN